MIDYFKGPFYILKYVFMDIILIKVPKPMEIKMKKRRRFYE